MRDMCRYACMVFLLCAGAVFLCGAALAAEPARGPQKNAEAMYAAVVKDWRALLQNDKRAAQRDAWLKLEQRFIAVTEADPKGNAGAKATYQAARCREELAERSKLSGDWQGAITHYLALAKKFPNHNLADDGLYQAAVIMAKHLNRPDNARATAQAVLDKYPKGDMARNAKKLLASLPKTSPAKPAAATQTRPATATPEAARPTAAKAETQGTQTAAPANVPPQLSRIVCRGTSRRSSVILEIDGAATYRHQFLAGSDKQPPRLLIDINGVSMGREVRQTTSPSGMVVSRVRAYALKGKNSVRVIIDLEKARHYTVDAGASPPEIHVQASTSVDLAGGAVPAGSKNGPVLQGRVSGTGQGKAGTLMEQLGLTVNTIMIDAGHGGKDPGAMGNGIRESQVTLTLAKMLGQRLRNQGFTVLYTRTGDRYVALDQRAVIANNKKADLFLSLHVNASKDKNTHGLETYFLDLARTSSAATVAARENAVSVKSISDLQFILTDIMLTSKLQESQDLAAVVHKNMCNRLRVAGFTVRDNGVRSAPFYVLMGARMPAVLVEIGYLSHNGDAGRIKSEKYLERLADGVATGVIEYKKKLARFTGK